MKVIFHLDLDSYFVSAERTINSALKNKPVVISTGQRRSIISAASYEAKKTGIYVPMPFYKAKIACPEVISVKPNFALYTSLSNKVFELISNNFTKNIEVGSIDECYIDVTDIWKEYGSPLALAKIIQKSLLNNLDLPSSIGIANNKFVAKMSTKINKPFGITVTKPGNHKRFWDWDLKEYFGIGAPTQNKLNLIGIKNIGNLARADVEQVDKVLGIKSQNLIDQANGKGEDKLNFERNELKSIGNSKTFMVEDLVERQDILEMLGSLVALTSHRAKIRNLVGWVVSVSIKKNGGKEIKPIIKRKTLKRAINSYDDIMKEATMIFDSIWDEAPLKFIGVQLDNLDDMFSTTYQSSIFDKEKKYNKTEEIINEVNKKFNKKVIKTATEHQKYQYKKLNQSRYLESDRIIKHYDKNYNKK